jgi:FMN-dependent NADH-azoreductase
MPKLLHIVASPRGDRSASLTVARHFLAAYLAKNPGDTVETLDLWQADLPEFDGPMLEAKYAVMHSANKSPEQVEAWKIVTGYADQFKAADKYVLSLPMWNFGIPYKLKQYIDIIAQPGLTFSFSPTEGYKGLVTGKPLVVVYGRGGSYGPGSGAEGYDAQTSYTKQIFGFMGFSDIKEILVEPTAAGPKEVAEAKGNQQADELAAAF